jgi:hypothetical protein
LCNLFPHPHAGICHTTRETINHNDINRSHLLKRDEN